MPAEYKLSLDELRVSLSYFVDTEQGQEPTPSSSQPKDTTAAATSPPKQEKPSINMAENEQGLSKNQLKKLQKKAEKAAKKQQNAGGNAPPTDAAVPAATKPTSIEPEVQTTSSQTTVIRNLKVNDATSAKVVWASMVYDVALQVQPSTKDDVDHSVLAVGSEQVSGGGNAMALTISLLSSSAGKISLTDQLMQDQWCEWERTVLRPAQDKKLSAALDHLEKSLSAGSGIHIVGNTMTVADIVLVSTLKSLPNKSFATALNRYMQAHAASWAKVEANLKELVDEASKSSSSVKSEFDLDLNQPSLIELVDALFRQAVAQVFGDVTLPSNVVSRCASPKHGDYQCSAAMPTFAALKKSGSLPSDIKSPQMVAKAIVEAVGADNPVVTDLSVNGPGFVACRIQSKLLQTHVNKFLETKKLPLPPNIKEQVCVVDFSSPNIAKEMHVGHLRSTIIGESVCRVLELVGHKVHRVNHVGDWGTQFGMLIQFLKDEYPNVSAGTELPNITDLTQFYKNAKMRFDESEEFKKKSQLNVVDLQAGDSECMRIWKLLCDISRGEFEKVYKRLDITIEECGESFYNDKIPPVIEEFNKAGLLKVEEGGAKCVFTDVAKIPLMLQKSDGGYGYDSTDMAALKYRLFDLKADRVIAITDFSQADHFKMVYAAGKAIGWTDNGQRLDHIGFGTVMGEDGKRFKTRSGDTVRLVDLLDEAASRMESILKERIAAGGAHITEADVHEVSEAIGYGSVKYFDLRRNPTSNYKFSYDAMLDTKGDTGVYLLYARARLESILAKAEAEHGVDLNDLGNVEITHDAERNLALALQQFPDVITTTLDDLFPYHICTYVYDLSNAASDFATRCRVLGSPEMKSRLLLCQATVSAMEQAFDLLGIRQVKRI